MTGGGGGLLGLRTSSYGSLLQQQQLQNGGGGQLLLPVQSTPLVVRKASKLPLAGPREKERLLPWICKIVGRRKVGMLLLAIVSILVFLSILSASSKEEDSSEGPETNWQLSHPFFSTEQSNPNVAKPSQFFEEDMLSFKIPLQNESKVQAQPLSINASTFPSRHPCEDVLLPSPPSGRKRTGFRPCEVCYVSVKHAMALMPSTPSHSPVLENLNYFSEENLYINDSNGGSLFSGRPSLQQRQESFQIRNSMTVHCGFFKGSGVGKGSGFDIDEMDLAEMEQCKGVVVASAIFGNYDIIHQPRNIADVTKKTVCFYMFLDEETEAYIKNSTVLNNSKDVGLWRLVIVKNLPYNDARRNGKVPKLLLHRLFPNARYSLWIDGKLELVKDPYQILERFLWRKNVTFAISRHYRRFDVFEEAEANKVAGKYDNTSIDYQIEFYKNEGLTHYSEAKLPITSDVPEGCVIIKEHIPITNLFTCLWFNEVDRFTSRDQISFSTVRDRIISQVNWRTDMFWDCERRNFVVQAYHKDLLEYMKLSIPPPSPPRVSTPMRKKPPQEVTDKTVPKPLVKKSTPKHPRDRRSGSRRHRSRTSNPSDKNSL